jgi:transketolase
MSVEAVSELGAWEAKYAGGMREVSRRTLLELALEDRRILCVDSDMGGLEEGFGAVLPDRYVNVGIAEANMMTIAAALARAGKIPFVNTMAGFASCRACEQVKIDIAYNNLPVKILATHAGLSAGHFGPTHQALEDVAIMRSMANMTVIVPADAVEGAKAVAAAVRIPGPVYIRLGRQPTDLVYASDYEFEPGRAVTLRPGQDVCIVAAGAYPVMESLHAHDRLAEAGISARVIDMHTIKPLDGRSLLEAAERTQGVVTVEDHSVIGGLGGAVAEFLGEHRPTRIRRIGMPDAFCDRVGPPTYLLEAYGMSSRRVVSAALELADRWRGPEEAIVRR